MKVLILILTLFSLSIFANEPLDSNIELVQDEFMSLNNLERFINSNPGVTLEGMKSIVSLKDDLQIIDTENQQVIFAKEMPIVSSFWWGCCLGIVGLLLVYIMTDNDQLQIKPAFWGCVIATIVWSAGGFFNPFGW